MLSAYVYRTVTIKIHNQSFGKTGYSSFKKTKTVKKINDKYSKNDSRFLFRYFNF